MKASRIAYLDVLRVFCIAFVVLEHATHPYSDINGDTWWLKDHQRSYLWDISYFVGGAFMLPVLFLVSGIFLANSLKKYGYRMLIWRKINQWLIPFFFGVFVILPIIFYPLSGKIPRSVEAISFWDFFWNSYLNIKPDSINFFGATINTFKFTGCISYLQYWFLLQIFIGAVIVATFITVFPKLFEKLRLHIMDVLRKNPKTALIRFVIASVILLGLPDLYIGGRACWVGYGRLFLVSPFFLLLCPYYILIGAMLGLKKDGKNGNARCYR